MALPTTISADRDFVDNRQFGGAFQIGGKTYVVIGDITTVSDADSFIYVYGASDPTSSFTLEDSTQRDVGDAVQSFWAVEHNSDIYIYVMCQDTDGLMYAIFDPGTDAFTTELTQIDGVVDDASGFNLFVSANIRSDDDQIILGSGDTESDMGTKYARIDYWREEGSGWSSAIAVDDAGNIHYKFGCAVKAESDKMQFAYYRGDTKDIEVKNLNSSNTLSSVDTVTTDITTSRFMLGGGSYYLDGSVDKVRFSLFDKSGAAGDELGEVFIDDDVVNASLQNVGWEDSTVETSGVQIHWMSEVMDGTKRYIMYIDDGNDINYTIIDDDGTPDADTEAIALINVDGIFCRVIDRSGKKLAYVYEDAGTIKYNEVDIGGSQTLTVPLLSSTTALFTPTLTTGSISITAPLLASTTALFTPQINLGLAVPLLSSTTALFTPTLTTGSISITAPLLGSTTALFTPTLTTGSISITAPLVASTTALFTPTISVSQTITAPLLSSTTTLFTPTLTTGAITITAPLIGSTTSLFTPTLTTGSISITAPLLASTTTLFTPQINLGLAVPLLSSTTALFTPTLTTGSISITAPLLASTTALFTPQINLGLAVPLLSSTTALFTPTLTTGSISITAPLIASTTALFTPTISVSQTITAPLLSSTTTLFTPTLTTGSISITAPLLASTTSLFTPTLTTGSISITAPLLSSTTSLFTPTLTTGSISITAPLLSSTTTLFTPTLTTGSISITAPLLSSTTALFTPQINLGLAVPLLSSTTALFTPTLTTGSISITAPLLASTTALFTPQINLGLAVSQIASTTSLFTPTLTTGSISITAPLLSSTTSLFTPTLTTGSISITAPLLASTTALFTPTLTTGSISITAPLIASTTALFTPQLNLGLAIPLISSTTALFTPTLTTGSISITAPLLASTTTLFTPTLTTTVFVSELVTFSMGTATGTLVVNHGLGVTPTGIIFIGMGNNPNNAEEGGFCLGMVSNSDNTEQVMVAWDDDPTSVADAGRSIRHGTSWSLESAFEVIDGGSGTQDGHFRMSAMTSTNFTIDRIVAVTNDRTIGALVFAGANVAVGSFVGDGTTNNLVVTHGLSVAPKCIIIARNGHGTLNTITTGANFSLGVTDEDFNHRCIAFHNSQGSNNDSWNGWQNFSQWSTNTSGAVKDEFNVTAWDVTDFTVDQIEASSAQNIYMLIGGSNINTELINDVIPIASETKTIALSNRLAPQALIIGSVAKTSDSNVVDQVQENNIIGLAYDDGTNSDAICVANWFTHSGTNASNAGHIGSSTFFEKTDTDAAQLEKITITTSSGAEELKITDVTATVAYRFFALAIGISLGTTITAPLIASTTTLFTPTLTTGLVTLTPPEIASLTTLYTPTLTLVTTLTLPAIASLTTLYTPTLTTGLVTLTPPAIASLTALYVPSLLAKLTFPAIASLTTLYTPTLTTGLVTLTFPLISAITTLYVPEIAFLWVDRDSSTDPTWADRDSATDPSYADRDSATDPSYADRDSSTDPTWSDRDSSTDPTWEDRD